VSALGGDCLVTTPPGGGTCVTVTVPLPASGDRGE
jgi:signal transduction histidine kinase